VKGGEGGDDAPAPADSLAGPSEEQPAAGTGFIGGGVNGPKPKANVGARVWGGRVGLGVGGVVRPP
jgi:hypothetical protein